MKSRLSINILTGSLLVTLCFGLILSSAQFNQQTHVFAQEATPIQLPTLEGFPSAGDVIRLEDVTPLEGVSVEEATEIPTLEAPPTATPVPIPTNTPTASSGTDIAMTVTLADLDKTDRQLNGRYASENMWIPFPTNWDVQEIHFKLNYKASPVLIPNWATLTIIVNETAVMSFSPVNDGNTRQVSFTVPEDLIYSEGISLTFEGYLPTTNDPCEGGLLPGQWVSILSSSEMTIQANERIEPPTLDRMQELIAGDNQFMPAPPILIVLPDNPDSQLLTAAAQVATRVGNGTDPLTVTTASRLTEQELSEANLVFVGLIADVPFFSQLAAVLPSPPDGDGFVTTDGIEIPAEHAVIQIFNSPWNPARKALLVTAGAPEGLQLAGDVFTDDKTFGSLIGQYQFVQGLQTTEEVASTLQWDMITLQDLGISDETITRQDLAQFWFSFKRPAGWLLQEGSELGLNLLISSPENDISSVAIYANGELVDVKPLEGVGRHSIIVGLPEAKINETLAANAASEFTLQFDVAIAQREEICIEVNEDLTWATIQNDTYLRLPHTFVSVPNLQVYPYPFVNELNTPVLILLPPEPNDELISAAVSIAAQLSAYALENINITLKTVDQTTPEEYASAHLIILGARENQPLVENMLTQAQVPGLSTYQLGSVGVLLETVSPWNPAYIALAAFGATTETALQSAQALTNMPVVTERGTTAIVEDIAPAAPIPGATAEATATPEEPAVRIINAVGDIEPLFDVLPTPTPTPTESAQTSDAGGATPSATAETPATTEEGGGVILSPEGEIIHIVTSGDTLLQLASQYGTTVEAIQEANNMDGTAIAIGQRLIIPQSR